MIKASTFLSVKTLHEDGALKKVIARQLGVREPCHGSPPQPFDLARGVRMRACALRRRPSWDGLGILELDEGRLKLDGKASYVVPACGFLPEEELHGGVKIRLRMERDLLTERKKRRVLRHGTLLKVVETAGERLGDPEG